MYLFQNVLSTKSNVLDFEKYIQENKTLLLNDPLREILLYPSDDVSVSILLMNKITIFQTLNILDTFS